MASITLCPQKSQPQPTEFPDESVELLPPGHDDLASIKLCPRMSKFYDLPEECESRPPHHGASVFDALDDDTFPEVLSFLLSPACTPDLTQEDVKRQGMMRGVKYKKTTYRELRRRRGSMGTFRKMVGDFIFLPPVQAFLILVVMFDCVCTTISFTSWLEEDHSLFVVRDLIVLFFLSFDVLARFFHDGLVFLQGKMNVFELVLVFCEFMEVLVLTHFEIPIPMLRILRPILRAVRVIRIIVRTAGRGGLYLSSLRRQVSGDRLRFTQDGFDLDLAYINSQMIVMPAPAAGRDTILNNPAVQVARFLNERHGNKYLLVNTTEQRLYSTSMFFGRYISYPIPPDSVPTLESLWEFCSVVNRFLSADPNHLVAIHSKHGQGRCSLVAIALMIYRGSFPTVTLAISDYERSRVYSESYAVAGTQTFDSASQRRFLDYFAHMCYLRKGEKTQALREVVVRRARLHRIQLTGVPCVDDIDVCVVGHPGSNIIAGTTGKASVLWSSESSAISPDHNEHHLLEDVLDIPEPVLAKYVKHLVEEKTYDSHMAGGDALESQPIMSSSESNGLAPKIFAVHSSEEKEDHLSQGVWKVAEQNLQGEIRLEVHRLRRDEVEDDHNGGGGIGARLWNKVSSRFYDNVEEHRFQEGMMFACWLHTGFLEMNEPHDRKRGCGKANSNIVTVVLDRYGLDKGKRAPGLRTSNAGLQLHLEFEVPQRFDFEAIAEEAEAEYSKKVLHTANSSEAFSLGWLTWLSEKTWPSFTSGLEKMIRDRLVPTLQGLPGPLKHVKLAHCSLGGEYPKFGPIIACSKSHDGLEVQLDIGLLYSTETNIVLDMGFAALGIKHFKIQGLLSLKFKPILDDLPVFSAVQILFLNAPDVDLRFARDLEIANSVRIRNIVCGAINKALSDFLVLPNIININWADYSSHIDSTISFQNIPPRNVARILIAEGRNVKAHRRRLPDPVVRVRVGQRLTQTATEKKTHEPEWFEEFDFLVHDERQHVVITVHDGPKNGKVVGRIRAMSVAELASQGWDGMWLTLENTPGAAKTELLVKARMLNFVVEPKIAARASIFVKTAEASRGTVTETGEVQLMRPLSSMNVELAEEALMPRKRKPQRKATGEHLGFFKGVISGADEDSSEDDEECDEGHVHSGAAAILVCDVAGGRLPPEVGLPVQAQIKITRGKATSSRKCAQAKSAASAYVTQKQQMAIERLAALGVRADQIADALGEDPIEVARIARKRGWNMAVSEKVCLLLHPHDVDDDGKVDIELRVKKKTVASGHVPFKDVVQAPNCRHALVVRCQACKPVELDMEFRLYALVEASRASL